MTQCFYRDFKSETDKFKKGPRAFCYDLSRDLIKKAKDKDSENWYIREETVNAIILLLLCWNFRRLKIKKEGKLNQEIKELLRKTSKNFESLKNKTILDFDEDGQDGEKIKNVYKEFKKVFGQTGASKALSLINPELFVMWDTKIREGVGRELKKRQFIPFIKEIANGEKSEHYLNFLKGIKSIIKECNNLQNEICPGEVLAKKIDEYHYVKFVMG